jgi:predicted nuclease of predicted toxin-antitoxin system
MRFLADENFPRIAVSALRDDEHDVRWIRTDAPGLDDRGVLSRAVAEERVLLTFDKDFGELAFHAGVPASCGIILFRLPTLLPQDQAEVVCETVAGRSDWSRHFSVVEENRIRRRALPEGP